MGIPSYFSYVVKNHRNIIKKKKSIGKKVDNLYLDSNSIIYDCLRIINSEYNGNDISFELLLMEHACLKLEEYIKSIDPKKRIMIAFDGVAPIAKLEQQRSRRFKSLLEVEINKKCNISDFKGWNKTAITPGTHFMKKLNDFTRKWFNDKYNNLEIIISGSNDAGEGEHKIFKYIRDNPKTHSNETTIIYGLDADLIMLCLNHLHVSKNIYLYRETPEFIKSIDSSLDPNTDYILDIPLLSQFIIKEMNNNREVNNTYCMYDYILLCFFLGNDFMPHFPALNIRTNGIKYLLNGYLNTIGKSNKNLTDGKNIFWGNLRELIEYLSKNEEEYIKNEYKIKDKQERRDLPYSTPEEKKDRYLRLPMKNRDIEKLIDPYSYGWDERYYKHLFKLDIDNNWKKKICVNYFEGLEWTLKYYTSGCVDWNWSYNYNYPPLLKDLLKYCPSWKMQMLEEKEKCPITSDIQLIYVLPKEYYNLISQSIIKKINKMDFYNDTRYDIQWSFCRYFWESHVILPHIDIDHLNEILYS